MAMNRWDPFRELTSIQNELNRLFGRTFAPEAANTPEGWNPPVDISETEDRFVIHVELAGVSSGDVDISVENAVLSIEGQRKFYTDQREDEFLRVERRFGSFTRSVTLPSTADVERIEASFDAGVLLIEVPKKEEAKPRRIEVKATG